jgi:hypothetical protein
MKRRVFILEAATAGAVSGAVIAHANPRPQESSSTKSRPAEQILSELVRQRFADRLSDEQMATVERQIAGNLRAIESLSKVRLTNADEPVLFPSDIYRQEAVR